MEEARFEKKLKKVEKKGGKGVDRRGEIWYYSQAPFTRANEREPSGSADAP